MKQQFLSMSTDYKHSENVTTPSAFIGTSDQDNRLVNSMSQQRKPHCKLSGPVSAESCQTSQYISQNSSNAALKKPAGDSMPNQWEESDKEETE